MSYRVCCRANEAVKDACRRRLRRRAGREEICNFAALGWRQGMPVPRDFRRLIITIFVVWLFRLAGFAGEVFECKFL